MVAAAAAAVANSQAPTSTPAQVPPIPHAPPPPPDAAQVAPFAAPDGTDVSITLTSSLSFRHAYRSLVYMLYDSLLPPLLPLF